jgi:hypothetical protein
VDTFLFASNQRKSTSSALVISVVVMSVTVTDSSIEVCGISWRNLSVWHHLIKSNLFTTCTLAPYSSFYSFNLLRYIEIESGGSGCMLGT